MSALATALFALTGHGQTITALAFSPDGTMLASASWDQTARLWSLADRKTIREFKGHDKPVLAIAFSPDGKLLATSSYDRTIKLWNVATGAMIANLTGHAKDVTGVAFSPDGKTLASCSLDGTARVWSLADPRQVITMSPGSYLRGLTFSPDGTTLVVAGEKELSAFKTADGGRIETLGKWGTGHQSLAFRAGGKQFATAAEFTVRIGELSGDPKILTGHRSSVLAIAFRPDGKLLASAGKDFTIRFWNPDTGEELQSLKGHEAGIPCLAFSPDGKQLASGSDDKAIKVWEIK